MRRTLKLKKPVTRFSTVMLIDDNEMDNFINQKIIEANGFAEKIYTNTNGLSAIEFLKNIYVKKEMLDKMIPDVVFVDLNMPILNGFQFIEKFYELPTPIVEKSKIVILTSSLNAADKDIARRLNPEIVFLNKPLTAEALASIGS